MMGFFSIGLLDPVTNAGCPDEAIARSYCSSRPGNLRGNETGLVPQRLGCMGRGSPASNYMLHRGGGAARP